MANVLYKVADFDGTDAWTDVSPVAGETPTLPHALSIDLIDDDVVNIYVVTSDKWYRSANAGTSWSTIESSTDANTFYTAGNSRMIAGTSEVRLALDGTTLDDKTGNLPLIVGGSQPVKRIQAL